MSAVFECVPGPLNGCVCDDGDDVAVVVVFDVVEISAVVILRICYTFIVSKGFAR